MRMHTPESERSHCSSRGACRKTRPAARHSVKAIVLHTNRAGCQCRIVGHGSSMEAFALKRVRVHFIYLQLWRQYSKQIIKILKKLWYLGLHVIGHAEAHALLKKVLS